MPDLEIHCLYPRQTPFPSKDCRPLMAFGVQGARHPCMSYSRPARPDPGVRPERADGSKEFHVGRKSSGCLPDPVNGGHHHPQEDGVRGNLEQLDAADPSVADRGLRPARRLEALEIRNLISNLGIGKYRMGSRW